MEAWIQEARRILLRAPTGALPLSVLREELARAGMHLGSRERWLLTSLEDRRGLFRIVRVPPGPWSLGLEDSELAFPLEEPWIVLQESPPRGYGSGEAVLGGIREAVQAWGRDLDDGSPSGVARWIQANREGVLTLRALFNSPGPAA